MEMTHLTLSWGISRGYETAGYNIRRLRDDSTGKRYRCMGGGYDMTGTVFGEWLQDVYGARLLELAREHAGNVWTREGGNVSRTRTADGRYLGARDGIYYGMTYRADDDRVTLDGACGVSSMDAIAEAMGLRVQWIATRGNGDISAVIITDTRAGG